MGKKDRSFTISIDSLLNRRISGTPERNRARNAIASVERVFGLSARVSHFAFCPVIPPVLQANWLGKKMCFPYSAFLFVLYEFSFSLVRMNFRSSTLLSAVNNI